MGLYSEYTKDDLWLIKEIEWVRGLQGIRESQFTLSNGYMGARGVLEDMPYDASPGTYLSGVYDKIGSQVDELVNLPNPVNFRFTVEGHKLDVAAMDVIEHKRALNMKKGLLVRYNLYRDAGKRRFEYESMRFVSMHNKNIGVMQINLTSMDENCTVDVNTGIDTSVANAQILSEGNKRHFRVRELGRQDHSGYLITETLEKKFIIAFWSGFFYETGRKKVYMEDNIFQLKLKKGQTVVFKKIFYIKHFPWIKNHAEIKNKTYEQFKKIYYDDYSKLLERHVDIWNKLWKKADIVIKGVQNIQQNLRFNIFHMISCGHVDNGFSSIGARTLSGTGYRGHIFWDTEIFLMPFYLYTFPEVAKNMLLYRYRRLNEARKLAKSEGYKGAKFPWESALEGTEQTPSWARDINSKIVRIHTHKMEHHITADIAYAVYQYYTATGDEKFMKDYGYEIMFSTARFWVSRVVMNKKKNRYDIPNVIGPDEFHINVKNNAFTNIMAKWNLQTAYELYLALKNNKKIHETLRIKLALKDKEAAEWHRVASRLPLSVGKNNIIEQFDGYFRWKKGLVIETDENGLPILPKRIGTKDISKTQFVKQADVLMIFSLFRDAFSEKVKKANYDFYVNRTIHGSSLSAAAHSLVACDIGDLQRSYGFFNAALRADISNLYGNTYEGIHAASLGGTWQAVVFGFSGISIINEKFSLDPFMPRTWRKIILSLSWKGDRFYFQINHDTVRIRFQSRNEKTINLYVFGNKTNIKRGKWHVFKKETARIQKKRYFY